jgi:hypothetical protein
LHSDMRSLRPYEGTCLGASCTQGTGDRVRSKTTNSIGAISRVAPCALPKHDARRGGFVPVDH